VMGSPFPSVDIELAISQLNKYISKETPAVLVKDMAGATHVITNYDLIQSLA
jgi:predicted transcriptional regulator